MQDPTRFAYVVYIDVILKGIAGVMVQLPDSIVFLLGYHSAKKKIPSWHWALIWTFLIVTLYLTWVPKWLIFPLVMRVDSIEFKENYVNPAESIQLVATILYEIGFTANFMYLLYRANVQRSIRIPKQAQIFLIKYVTNRTVWRFVYLIPFVDVAFISLIALSLRVLFPFY